MIALVARRLTGSNAHPVSQEAPSQMGAG